MCSGPPRIPYMSLSLVSRAYVTDTSWLSCLVLTSHTLRHNVRGLQGPFDGHAAMCFIFSRIESSSERAWNKDYYTSEVLYVYTSDKYHVCINMDCCVTICDYVFYNWTLNII